MVHMNVRLVEKNSDIYNVEETANAESVFAVSRLSLLNLYFHVTLIELNL